MKNLKIILVTLVLVSCFSFNTNSALATQLPQPIVEFIKKKYPEVGIRFDGLIELPDHTVYLPILPLNYGKPQNPAAITQTIPANTDFSKKPDMVLFANNLALLKIIKQNDELTVNYSKDIPLVVKLGILPQDLIVPQGLILPMELKVILGDLKIPLKPKKDEGDLIFFGDTYTSKEKKVNFSAKNLKNLPELDCIKNKVLYASNYKDSYINIIDSQTGRINANIKLPSIPSNIALTADGRYLLVPALSANKLFVVDTYNDTLVKDIEVGKLPSSVLTSASSDKAYVANKLSSTISVIDVKNMLFKKEIKVNGSPENLVLEPESQTLYYNDSDSGNIYLLNTEKESSVWVTCIKNISKMKLYKEKLFILSRSENELVVFNIYTTKEEARIKLGEKPVDIELLKKRNGNSELYILSAGSDELNIIDLKELKLTDTISLKSGGFPGEIIPLEKENRLLITNYDAYQIAIFDTEKKKIIGNMPISKPVSFLQVSK